MLKAGLVAGLFHYVGASSFAMQATGLPYGVPKGAAAQHLRE
jgi:hypothetical protein